MRPPDLPGGNSVSQCHGPPPYHSFNEAAGFTRRKPERVRVMALQRVASMRPPDLPGGNVKGMFRHDIVTDYELQ